MRALLWTAAACASCAAPARDAAPPTPREVRYAQDFDEPGALDDFAFSDPGAWDWDRGALKLARASDYDPPHRSPRSIALLRGLMVDAFVLEVELTQTGREYAHRDLCLFFGFQDPAHYHYVHLATTPDENAHNVFQVAGAPRRPLLPVPPAGVDWGTRPHRVRMELAGDRLRVWFDDAPVFDVRGLEETRGRVGLGSFDDVGRFDRLRLVAPDAWEAPDAWFGGDA